MKLRHALNEKASHNLLKYHMKLHKEDNNTHAHPTKSQLTISFDNLKKKPMVMDMADTFGEDFGIHFNQWSSNIRAGFNHIVRNGSH